ncbi:hypothetical protein GF382_00905 [Candidatus Falkowbacteria bacterium]|nr:hypothetical protein [Candidatus Falkowbacteria bacterium]
MAISTVVDSVDLNIDQEHLLSVLKQDQKDPAQIYLTAEEAIFCKILGQKEKRLVGSFKELDFKELVCDCRAPLIRVEKEGEVFHICRSTFCDFFKKH